MNYERANKNTNRNIQWFPILIILWNIIDIVVHVALNMAEPWRIAGNVVGIVAALVVAFGVAKTYEWQILSGTDKTRRKSGDCGSASICAAVGQTAANPQWLVILSRTKTAVFRGNTAVYKAPNY